MARSRSSASKQAARARQSQRPAKQPAAPPPPPVPAAPPEATFTGLRRFNAAMGALHLVQGILMVVLSNAKTYPIYSNYLHFDTTLMKLTPNHTLTDQIRFGPAVAVFLFISAAAHFCLATFGYRWYVSNLRRHMNPARFYEYALSSSLMIVLIGMLVGIYDVGTMVLLFGINAAMNLFGILMERQNQTTTKTDWTPFIFGCIAGIIPWVVIAMYLVGSAVQSGQQAPGFVYGIIVSLFVFFFSFAANMYLQYKKVGPWKDYLFGERMFIILSLVAKTALAWQIFAGTLAPV
jgi:hypothetical protein